MIIGQLASCEECRDASCKRCKNAIRRYKRKWPHAPKSLASIIAAKKAGHEIVEVRLTKLEESDFSGLPQT